VIDSKQINFVNKEELLNGLELDEVTEDLTTALFDFVNSTEYHKDRINYGFIFNDINIEIALKFHNKELEVEFVDYVYATIDIEFYREEFKSISVNAYDVDIVRPQLNSRNEDYNFIFRDFEDFFSYVKQENIKSVFFNELFIDIDTFFITEELLKNIPVKISEYLKEDITRINEKSSMLIEELPDTHFLEMRCINQGQVLYYKVVDEKIALSATGEELLNYLINNIPSEKKTKLIRETEEDKKLELKKLEDFIINDSDFHNSTNLNLRRDYLKLLKEKYPTYQDVLNVNGINPFNSMTFIDRLWKIHKMR
jgi:hypothetical protein